MTKPNDYPIDDCAAQAALHMSMSKLPMRVHQKWTCKHCGARQTMEEPNEFFRQGKCEECRKITDITHCNYMLVMGKGADTYSNLTDQVK
jgi:hypothetical protein